MAIETKIQGVCSNEDIKPYMKLAYGVASEYMQRTNDYNFDIDDLAMMGLDKIYGYWEREKVLPDMKLAKTIVDRTLINMTVAAHTKKRKASLNPLSLDYVRDDDQDSVVANGSVQECILADTPSTMGTEDKTLFEMTLKELKEKYAEGTPERKFLEFYLEKSGLDYFGVYEQFPELEKKHNDQKHHYNYTKSDCAIYMGYYGTSDNKYIKKTNEIKEIIKNYFNI